MKKENIATLIERTEQREAEAQCQLGFKYRNGEGIAKSDEKAAYWTIKAADQGHLRAIGLKYDFGYGVEKDPEKAAEWYFKAAEQGYATALCNLGNCYKNGQGVEKDFEKAVEWYTKADGLRTFVKALIDNEYSVKFYTTNYDRIVPRLLPDIEFDEGLQEIVHDNSFNEEFVNNSHWQWTADTVNQEYELDFSNTVVESQDAKPLLFHNDLMKFCKAPYTYYNLHGSRYLSFNYSKGQPCFDINGTDYASAIGRYGGSNPNEYLMFTPIIAGYTKSQRALTEPFHFGFTSFTIDCNTCNKFFSLGYSYKDPHINSIISSNLQEDVLLECIVNDTINEEIITPKQLKLQKKSKIKNVKSCTKGRIFEGGIEEYFEKRMYEAIL